MNATTKREPSVLLDLECPICGVNHSTRVRPNYSLDDDRYLCRRCRQREFGDVRDLDSIGDETNGEHADSND